MQESIMSFTAPISELRGLVRLNPRQKMNSQSRDLDILERLLGESFDISQSHIIMT